MKREDAAQWGQKLAESMSLVAFLAHPRGLKLGLSPETWPELQPRLRAAMELLGRFETAERTEPSEGGIRSAGPSAQTPAARAEVLACAELTQAAFSAARVHEACRAYVASLGIPLEALDAQGGEGA